MPSNAFPMADKHLQFLDIPRKRSGQAHRRAAHPAISRDLFAVQRRSRPVRPGRPLPVVRQSVLRVEVSGPQLHSQLAGAGQRRQAVRGGGALASNQFAARDVRAHLPAGSAVRRRLHAERRPRRRQHRRHREVHHGRGVQAGVEARSVERRAHRTSAWRSSVRARQAWPAPMSWCATASRPSSSIAIPRSADC